MSDALLPSPKLDLYHLPLTVSQSCCYTNCMHSFAQSWIMVMPFMQAFIYLSLINRLQSILNSAAQPLDGIRKHGHLSNYLYSFILNISIWMPVWRQCIESRILLLMLHSYLARNAPSYLRQSCIPVPSLPGHRPHRPATHGNWLYTAIMQGPESFAVVSPSPWTWLPYNLWHKILLPSMPLYGKRLKTILFNCGLV